MNWNRRRRAVSPVIAVILLIGLTVAAASMMFLVVMPMIEPKASLDITDGYYYYNEGLEKPKKNPKAQADAYVIEFTVRNVGTKVVTIDSVTILDKDGNDMSATLHTPEYIGEELQTISDFDFLLSFVKKNNPSTVVRARITVGGKTYYSNFIDLE